MGRRAAETERLWSRIDPNSAGVGLIKKDKVALLHTVPPRSPQLLQPQRNYSGSLCILQLNHTLAGLYKKKKARRFNELTLKAASLTIFLMVSVFFVIWILRYLGLSSCLWKRGRKRRKKISNDAEAIRGAFKRRRNKQRRDDAVRNTHTHTHTHTHTDTAGTDAVPFACH